jgi:hypothetical protein
MKSILTFVLASVAAAPAFAIATVPTPDGGATALLAAISVGGLVIAKNVMKKR